MRACVCVFHLHCSAQLSMFNTEKRCRNKITIINPSFTTLSFDVMQGCVISHIYYLQEMALE